MMASVVNPAASPGDGPMFLQNPIDSNSLASAEYAAWRRSRSQRARSLRSSGQLCTAVVMMLPTTPPTIPPLMKPEASMRPGVYQLVRLSNARVRVLLRQVRPRRHAHLDD